MTRTDTQAKQIAEHLKKFGWITPLDALNKYRCMRLAARCAELRDQGMNIKTVMVTTEDGARHARYTLMDSK